MLTILTTSYNKGIQITSQHNYWKNSPKSSLETWQIEYYNTQKISKSFLYLSSSPPKAKSQTVKEKNKFRLGYFEVTFTPIFLLHNCQLYFLYCDACAAAFQLLLCVRTKSLEDTVWQIWIFWDIFKVKFWTQNFKIW